MKVSVLALILGAATVVSCPAIAQEEGPAPAPAVAEAGQSCELHVFPTVNYIGLNSGLLSGFGVVGALADMDAHKNRVMTVKELMAGYLGPEIQMEELNKLGIARTLGLSPDYRIVVEDATPSADEARTDPAVKAKAKEMNATIKAGKRLTSSTNPCYAELLFFNVFYHKAMMYGSNLFVGTMLRDFSGGKAAPVTSSGAVKNPLEDFPPKSEEKVAAAKAELRDAFSKDFVEWSQKKLVKPASASAE